MDPRTLQLLEFPKILRHLSSFAASAAGQRACLAIVPETDLSRIAERSALVREVMRFCAVQDVRLGSFPDIDGLFEFLKNPLACLDQDGLIGLWEMLKAAAALLETLGKIGTRP